MYGTEYVTVDKRFGISKEESDMYRKGLKGWAKHFDFMIIDLICMHIALLVAYALRHGSWLMYENELYEDLLIPLTLINIVVAIMTGTFSSVLRRGVIQELASTIKHVAIIEIGLLMYLFAIHMTTEYSRKTITVMAVIYVCLSIVCRMIWKKFLLKWMKKGGHKSLIIVTTSDKAEKVIKNIADYNYQRYLLSGIVLMDNDGTKSEIAGVPVVAGAGDAVDYICNEWVDEVLVRVSAEYADVDELIDSLHQMGITVHVVMSQRIGTDGVEQRIEKIGNYNVLTSSVKYVEPLEVVAKRILDILGGLVGCIITVILTIIIGPIIFIKSPGPIFFSQTRIGRNGRKFKIYKFRSMYMDAEERKKELMSQNKVSDGMMFKMDWDPRIIGSKILPDGTKKKGIGNYIRDWSLDEFPQFWNVLKGDMSLVGTRPPTEDEWEKYEPWHRTRLAVKPGITGMWQVSGRSNITDFEEVVKLDTQYLNNWSFALDVEILFKTVKTVVKKEGSM